MSLRTLYCRYKQLGSLVLAFNEEDVKTLHKLYKNGIANGVDTLEVITDVARIRAMEPHASTRVIAALYCTTTGVVSPYEYCIALMESALLNAGAGRGLELRLKHTVCDMQVRPEHAYKFKLFIDEHEDTHVHAKHVVNCSGVRADMLSSFAGATDGSVRIVPRKGEYVVLSREEGKKINHVLFQCPSKHGKGVLVSPTARGNLLLGPTAVYSDSVDVGTSYRHLKLVLKFARKTYPGLDVGEILTTYAGIRPNSDLPHRDFVIAESKKVPQFVNVAGIGSPGLTCSYPIAQRVVQILREAGLGLSGVLSRVRKGWTPHRRGIIGKNWLEEGKRSGLRVGHPNPSLNIVCKCECVTEQTIVDACHRLIPVSTVQQVKFRTRAGMGSCQGRRCHKQVRELVSVASGIPVDSVKSVGDNRKGRRVPVKELCKL
jgi:glycerol-3-phosphate dehydrogenase